MSLLHQALEKKQSETRPVQTSPLPLTREEGLPRKRRSRILLLAVLVIACAAGAFLAFQTYSREGVSIPSTLRASPTAVESPTVVRDEAVKPLTTPSPPMKPAPAKGTKAPEAPEAPTKKEPPATAKATPKVPSNQAAQATMDREVEAFLQAQGEATLGAKASKGSSGTVSKEQRPSVAQENHPPRRTGAGATRVSSAPAPEKPQKVTSRRLKRHASGPKDSVQPFLLAADRLLRDGKTQEALAAYRRILRLDPTSREAALGVALVRATEGRWSEAFSEFRNLADRFPKDPTVRLNLAIAHLRLHRPRKALEELEVAAAAGADPYAVWLHRGVALKALGRRDEAVRAYQEAHRLRPGNVEPVWNLAVALDAAERYNEAMDAYRRLLGQYPLPPRDRDRIRARLAELQRNASRSMRYQVSQSAVEEAN